MSRTVPHLRTLLAFVRAQRGTYGPGLIFVVISMITALGYPYAIRLTIDCPMSGHGRHACVALEVDSADDCFHAWRDRVANIRPPRDEPWGARTFDLSDPFGNTIFVIGPTRPAP